MAAPPRLNEHQQAAVDRPASRPLCIVAGAGCGKTRTLVERVVSIVTSDTTGAGLLMLTFSNKAAKELKERLAERLAPQQARRVQASTFHAFAHRLLRCELAADHELGGKFALLGPSGAAGLLRRCCVDLGIDKERAPGLAADIRRYTTTAGREPLGGQARAVREAYVRRKREMRTLDLDDLVPTAGALLQAGLGDDAGGAAKARRRWAFGFVDEFQDTSASQLGLVKALFPDGRVTAVGDDDQSIYSWRDASPSALRDFGVAFGAETVALSENYRR